MAESNGPAANLIPTRERRRAARAMPPRESGSNATGCVVTIVLGLLMCAFFWWLSRWWLWGLFAAWLLWVCFLFIRAAVAQRWLIRSAARTLEPSGIRFLVVYSDSPHWQDYIEREWLPRFGVQAKTLNWTRRKEWDHSQIEVRLFDAFIKSWRNFNPAVLVLRDSQRPLVYRFYYAFKEARGGRSRYLEALERELFEHVQ